MFQVPLPKGKGSKDSKEKSFDERQNGSPAIYIRGRDRIKKSSEYHFCLPEKIIGLIKEIENQPPDIVGFSIARLEYLLSTIVTHRQHKYPGAYSELNMRYLQNIVPRAGEYLLFLKDNDIIEWNNYSAGRNSRLYRIDKQYDGKIVYRTITDNYLIRRIEQGYQQIKQQYSKKYPFLNRFVDMVRIDVNAAYDTIEKTYNENPDRDKAEARRTFSIGEVIKINEGHIYKKVNSTNHRYDTNYTRLPGELVKHLTINGKPLIELDITNSQPFFAVSLFNPSPEIQKIIGQSFTMYVKSLQLTDKKDVRLYTSLVTEGIFYDFMREQFNKYGIKITDINELKEQCFRIFFAKNNSINYSPAVQLFAESFPNVYRLFALIKKGEYSRLAIMLQQIEAYIMLDCVARRLNEAYPELVFITKHDSILAAISPEESVEVKKLIQEEIASVIGYVPKIRIKPP